MSVRFEIYRVLYCNGCYDQFEFNDVQPAEVIRENAKDDGWKRKRVGTKTIDLCPACAVAGKGKK